MQTTGRVLDVFLDNAGTAVYEDTATSATTLNVVSAGVLDEAGGEILILDDVYTYSDIVEFEDYDTITISPGLLHDVVVGDEVNLSPLVTQKMALVHQADEEVEENGSEDNNDIIASIAPGLADTFAVESRDDSLGEYVLLDDESGDWVITACYGREGLVRGESIDPESTVPPAALTDGLPPESSPTPVLEQFAVGGLKWSLDPVDNADPVRFKIYADTVDPPTQDTAHLVADSSSTSGFFGTIDGVRLLPEDPSALPVMYYVAAVEYDADGEAAMGATSNAAAPRRADNSDISASYGYFGFIEANQIAAGSVLTQLLNVGDYVEIDGDQSSITIFADLDHTQPLVQLRPDGSVFRGQVIADDISVLNGLILQGLLSHIAQNAGITLDSSIKDPSIAPVLTLTPLASALDPLPSGYLSKGMCSDGTGWLRLIRLSGGTTTKVQTLNSAGHVTATVTLSNVGTNVAGITKVGTKWYIYAYYEGDGEGWYLIEYATTGGSPTNFGDSLPMAASTPGLGTDGTDIYTAYHISDFLYVHQDNMGTGHIGTYVSSSNSTPDGSSCRYVSKGNFDFGASRIVVSSGSKVAVFTLSGSTLTEQTAQSFDVVENTFYGGFMWDGSNFYSVGSAGKLNKYNGYYPAASENAYVAHRDNNGADHTKVSPIASIAMKKRYYLQAALAPVPSGAATPSVWMKLATSTPAATALLARSETITTRNVLINPGVAGGAALTTDTNTFGTGTPGWIKSQLNGLEIYGDGTFVLETYPVTGAWTAYTPAWTGATTNPTAANHSITGKYKRIGKLVHFKIQIVVGSSGYGSGAYSVSLPFTAADSMRVIHNGSLRTNITIPLFAEQTSTTALLLRVLPTTAGGGFTSMAQGTPVTLASGDTIVVEGTYEPA